MFWRFFAVVTLYHINHIQADNGEKSPKKIFFESLFICKLYRYIQQMV
jgi:hypothetical protein